ncbi:MAG: ABC transporter transmembrane domain-containing protein, partial [bacterium]|nr:ABC transporter transmembrane domain-containing protein [bacterium]
MEEKTKNTKEGLWASLGVLKKYLKKYRRETVVLSALGIVSAFGNGTIPLVAGRFFDAIITPSSFSFLDVVLPLFAWLLIIWTAVQIITYSVDWQINIKSENFSNKVWVDYWAAGVGYILTLPMSYHKSRKVGEMGEKINRAAFSLETIIGRIVIDLAPQFLSILIALGVTFYLKPILAVALIVGIVSYTVILA